MRRPALLVLAALLVAGVAQASPGEKVKSDAPQLLDLRLDNGSTPFAGDSTSLTTVSPNGDGFRDVVRVRFRLRAAATVTMDVTRTVKVPHVIYTLTEKLGPGAHTMTWQPLDKLNPRTYLIRMTVVNAAGRRTTYGAPNAFVGRYPKGLVVRLQGIDAGFGRPNYAPGQMAGLHVATDEPSLELRIFQSGPEKVVTYADNQLAGVDTGAPPVEITMARYQSKPRDITVKIPNLPSGLYYAQLTGPDGRVGYAPFVVRPSVLGATSRVLVVLPTNTWQAYNFQDVDGNGYGDTWYAGPPNGAVSLSRTYIARGVPPRFYRYDLPFLHWLYWSGKSAEFISDSDFDLIADGDELAGAYDLVVFEGHEEYVTSHEYDVVQRYRDLGGNLMFLSANNFFWKVNESGRVLRKVGKWRDAGRPEARLIGVQYRANDDGQRQGVFTVQNAAATPWLWDGTGLADGSTFGQFVGGYGIEIDSATADSPPGTVVVAQIPDLLGPGATAQMSYYETPGGAKVFAAGALDFGGSATFWPVKRLLDNLWSRLSQP
ncbi:MAG TPA: N,N-dimethylformamidase beta subunit family domain-containing protein [Gaiellaceae bacterium]|nr:N,N-dimethylformamidase beta subunit family domain-containing protein [Gaiellaceae bacterium]